MDKQQYRNQLLKWRGSMSKETWSKKSKKVFNNLTQLTEFKSAKKILLYYSSKTEVDTLQILNAFKGKKSLYLPVVLNENLLTPALFKGLDHLKENKYGIPEPIAYNSKDKISFDLIIVPGVGFTKKGVRLGMGKGYYDRFFQKNKTSLRIALAFEEQILDSIPKDNYDENVDVIVTDEQIYYANR